MWIPRILATIPLIILFSVAIMPTVNASYSQFYECRYEDSPFGEPTVFYPLGLSTNITELDSTTCIGLNNTDTSGFVLQLRGYPFYEVQNPVDIEDAAAYTGAIFNPTNAYDEDWSTYAGSGGAANIYENFTIPSDTVAATWRFKGFGDSGFPVENQLAPFCYDGTSWVSYYQYAIGGATVTKDVPLSTSCINRSTLEMRHSFSGIGVGYYEGNVTFTRRNYTKYPSNISIDVDNNSIYDYNFPAKLNNSNSPIAIELAIPSDKTLLAGFLLPLHIVSSSNGTIELSTLNLNPSFNFSTPADGYTTTNTSIIISTPASDADNTTLNYYLIWNNTLITQNTVGIFNFTHDGLEKTNTWTVNVSDGINKNITTSPQNIIIDYTWINLYDENLGTHRVDNGSIFFLDSEYRTVAQQTGNNVSFTNLDIYIGEKITVKESNASNTLYPYQRELVSTNYTAGEDYNIYSPSSNDIVVYPKLTLNDVTGDFPANVTILRIKRYIQDDLITVHESIFGLDKTVAAYLIADVPYQISIENNGETREKGEYRPKGSDIVPIYLGPVTYAPGTNIYDIISWNITKGSIKVLYNDASAATTYLSIVIYNESNRSTVLTNCTVSLISTYTCTYAPPGNLSVYVTIDADTGYGPFHTSKLYQYWSSGINFDVGLLEPWHYTLLTILLTVFTMLIFNEINSGLGAIAGAAMLGLCRFFGWITISESIMGVIVLFAFFTLIARYRSS